MATCYVLEPEVPGGLGPETELDRSTHPPRVDKLHLTLEGWLGDELIESFPAFVVTERGKQTLERRRLKGFRFVEVKVSPTAQFEELYPGRRLPAFSWLQIFGTACHDDFGLAEDGRLVVSEAALQALRTLSLTQCEV